MLELQLVCVLSGKAGEMVDRGDNTYGGKYVVNPSGGLISKGHPLGATGRLHTSMDLISPFRGSKCDWAEYSVSGPRFTLFNLQ